MLKQYELVTARGTGDPELTDGSGGENLDPEPVYLVRNVVEFVGELRTILATVSTPAERRIERARCHCMASAHCHWSVLIAENARLQHLVNEACGWELAERALLLRVERESRAAIASELEALAALDAFRKGA